MKKIIENKYKIIAVLLPMVILLPMIAFAVIVPSECSGATPEKCNFDVFMKLINGAINWFISISAIVAAIAFAVAGARMLMHPGNPGERQKAVEMFQKTVIGLLIVLGAWLAIHTIITALIPNSTSGTGALRFL